MAVVMFYHITRSSLEQTAANLLTRALGAGWPVMLRGTEAEKLDQLDQALWLGPEDGFLPHGREGGPHDALQPILLGTGPIANQARALMMIDGATFTPQEAASLERVWVLFDGLDEAAVAKARTQWKAATAAGLSAQYWSEEDGSWAKKAEATPPAAKA
ncbi:MAG: DNA polymerase III subunit chi [Pseudorhodobacter sp.]|nr:DNA polymerase III subunit chi [Pseudorhodobacter sp.]